jgi:methionine aminopeptidase
VVLKDGQVVKIDLGVHVDGYVATAAHTMVIGASKVGVIEIPNTRNVNVLEANELV